MACAAIISGSAARVNKALKNKEKSRFGSILSLKSRDCMTGNNVLPLVPAEDK
jgi:hypothetical protein